MTKQAMEAAVQVQSVRKAYGAQQVLDGIDLEVAHGETLAILGQSGTGKSVLLRLIVGLQQLDAGSIRIDGQEVAGIALQGMNVLRQKIGFVFQSAALYDSMTVGENVAFPLIRHAPAGAKSRDTQVQQLLASVGMEKEFAKMPGELSGGMKKRVGLARALALAPAILLFDEPTTGLDPITAAEISELILKLQRDRKVASIIVTHDVQVAQAVADRLAILRDGRILVTGTFDQLKDSHDAFVIQFLRLAGQG